MASISHGKVDISKQSAVAKQARGYIRNFMLNSAEHKLFPAHKC